jgi:hypothetical protein
MFSKEKWGNYCSQTCWFISPVIDFFTIHMPVDHNKSKRCAPAFASIWGMEGGVGKGLFKLNFSVDYFVIYDFWKIIVYCRSPQFLISIVLGAEFVFCPHLADLMPGTKVGLVLTVQHTITSRTATTYTCPPSIFQFTL